MHYQYDIEVIEDEATSNARSLNWSYNKNYEEAGKASGSYVLTISHTDWQAEDLVCKYHQLGDIRKFAILTNLGLIISDLQDMHYTLFWACQDIFRGA